MTREARCAILDFDDTLMATRERRTAALRHAGEQFGYDLEARLLRAHWGKPFNQLVAGLFAGIDYQRFCKCYAASMRLFPPEPTPGARELLELLRNRGAYVFLVTSGNRALVQQDLETAGMWDYVDRLWGFEDTEYHKPDPRVLTPVMAHLKEVSNGKQLIYVGDSVFDYEVACAHGIPFVGVLSGSHTRSDFLQAGLDEARVVDSLHDLLRLGVWFEVA